LEEIISENNTQRAKPWLLWLGLLVALISPVVIALTATCYVPRMDDWGLVIQPYFKWIDGEGFWSFLRSVGNDSRHDAVQWVHALVIKQWSWNPVLESLLCVGLGGVAVAVTLDWWTKRQKFRYAEVAAGLLGVFLMLSPAQWMNWSWGIQLCYMMPVAATLLMFWVLNQNRLFSVRVIIAILLSWIAVFSFANGWLAVVLGGALLLWKVARKNWSRAGVGAVMIWLASSVYAGWVYASGWPKSKGIGDSGLFTTLINEPLAAASFFAKVLGAPLADIHVTAARSERVAVQDWVSVGVTVAALAVLAASLIHLWRRRSSLSEKEVAPWIMLVLLGLGNAMAVTLARMGEGGHGPFHSRYPAFTGWFFLGLLGLLTLTQGRSWRRVTILSLVLMGIGTAFGTVQGWMDVERMKRHGYSMEAAVALRKVAPEPVFLAATRPWNTQQNVGLLDRLELEGLLHVKTIPSENVSDAPQASKEGVKGQLTGAEAVKGGVRVIGWAFNAQTLGPVRAVALSYQTPGGEEKWLGIASRFTVMHNKAEKEGARVHEDRIGWVYEPLSGEEKTFMVAAPLGLKRRELPQGELMIRAYAFDPLKGLVTPLSGTKSVVLPKLDVATPRE
jgi:hypothetical protein